MEYQGLERQKRLREWISLKGWSVGEFARKLGVSQSAASQLLTGVYQPGIKTQEKLRSLGCPIDWLMTGQEKKVVAEKTVEYLILKKRLDVLERENAFLKRRLDEILKILNPQVNPPRIHPKARLERKER